MPPVMGAVVIRGLAQWGHILRCSCLASAANTRDITRVVRTKRYTGSQQLDL
jgi:hypothetical protein